MRVLVVSPHPDDSDIGLGGQIRLHVLAGDEVEVVLLSGGELGCPGEEIEETAARRIHEAYEAAAILGSTVVQWYRYPDGSMTASGEMVNDLAKLIAERKPDRIYVPWYKDGHPDHRAAADAVKYCLEKTILSPEVWAYEVWSPLSEYDEAVDISDVIGSKLTAIRCHESQVNRIRFDEAALALARWRGELHNRPHGMFAEVFKVVT